MRVVVCDDFEDRGHEAIHSIKEAGDLGVEVTPVLGDQLTEQLRTLFKGIRVFFEEPSAHHDEQPTIFDQADLVLIDNNLAQLDIEGARITAEFVAGYIRAFSSTPYIVSLNKNSDVDFDLSYLIGDHETKTDLAINESHLVNRALWTGRRADAKDRFQPWYWPSLLEAPGRRRSQIDFVAKHLDRSVTTAFGFPSEAIGFLSRHARAELSPYAGPQGDDTENRPILSDVTFIDVFLTSARSLPDARERKIIADAAQAGSPKATAVMTRVVAAEIDLWFRRDVVGPQEALVDIPHFMMRMPFVLGENVAAPQKWNLAVDTREPPYGIDPKLFNDVVQAAEFRHQGWVQSPSFWWPLLRNDPALTRLLAPSDTEWADLVFCEDISEFVERAPTTDAPPKEFLTNLEGPWDRRHVAGLDGIKYSPRTNFAL